MRFMPAKGRKCRLFSEAIDLTPEKERHDSLDRLKRGASWETICPTIRDTLSARQGRIHSRSFELITLLYLGVMLRFVGGLG